jgi:hypothetical protein
LSIDHFKSYILLLQFFPWSMFPKSNSSRRQFFPIQFFLGSFLEKSRLTREVLILGRIISGRIDPGRTDRNSILNILWWTLWQELSKEKQVLWIIFVAVMFSAVFLWHFYLIKTLFINLQISKNYCRYKSIKLSVLNWFSIAIMPRIYDRKHQFILIW